MKTIPKFVLFFISISLALGAGSVLQAASDVPLVTKEELKAMLDDPLVQVIDVRKGKDWTSSEFMIQGAVRAAPEDYADWANVYPKDKTLVLYCA